MTAMMAAWKRVRSALFAHHALFGMREEMRDARFELFGGAPGDGVAQVFVQTDHATRADAEGRGERHCSLLSFCFLAADDDGRRGRQARGEGGYAVQGVGMGGPVVGGNA